MAAKWNVADIPRQGGRTVFITGTGGIGYETALVLIRVGAKVIIAGRNANKGKEALEKIRAAIPAADLSFELVDLANLASIKACGERMRATYQSLDVLINNAAVMTPPKRLETTDGFELQFGTNYLGPFALTRELMPLLQRGDRPRVVTLSAIADRRGKIDFDDLQSERSYKPWVAYGQSKLADLIFAFELQRRSQAAGWGVTSIAVHPGIANTNLTIASADPRSITARLGKLLIALLMKPAPEGAWPSLFAATSPDARGGAYYGPDGFDGLRGAPALARVPERAKDSAVAQQLWAISEQLTGAAFR
jgi:NAD(P)-dependent dehydrogenase (short-subunit alcohol dehydrogenase family)